MKHSSTIFRKRKSVTCPYCEAKSRVNKHGELIRGCSHLDKYYMAGDGYVFQFSITLHPPRYTKIGRRLQDRAVKKIRSDIHDKVTTEPSSSVSTDRDLVSDFCRTRYSRDTKKTKRYYADDLSDYLNTRKWKKKMGEIEAEIVNLRAVKQYEVVKDRKLGLLVKQIKEIKRRMREAKRRENTK